MRQKKLHPSSTAWIALGGLFALGCAIMIMREFPAMRRELRLMRM